MTVIHNQLLLWKIFTHLIVMEQGNFFVCTNTRNQLTDSQCLRWTLPSQWKWNTTFDSYRKWEVRRSILWKEWIPAISDGYSANDIWNMDETDCLWSWRVLKCSCSGEVGQHLISMQMDSLSMGARMSGWGIRQEPLHQSVKWLKPF